MNGYIQDLVTQRVYLQKELKKTEALIKKAQDGNMTFEEWYRYGVKDHYRDLCPISKIDTPLLYEYFHSDNYYAQRYNTCKLDVWEEELFEYNHPHWGNDYDEQFVDTEEQKEYRLALQKELQGLNLGSITVDW